MVGNGSKITLIGSGSTFIYPQLDRWIKALSEKNPQIIIEYSPSGSGTGQTQFMQGLIDFAGSDPPLTTSDWEKAKNDPRGVIQLPVLVGSVVITYNIPGIASKLKLTGEVLSLIYKGEIEYWDDRRIAELNQGISLPHEKIVAVHRSDSSGTTNIFTLFLYKSSNGLWPRDLVGKAIDWPVDKTGRGLGGKGNQGVADIVSRTPYSLGYVEYAYAFLQNLPTALIMNSEGIFVEANMTTMMEAIRASMDKLPQSPEGDFNDFWNAVIYSPGKQSYPVTSFAFLIFHKVYPSNKVEGIKQLIQFINNEGRNYIIEGYVPIPDELARFNLNSLNLIVSG
ncbi:MAG: phosphate ABC transporter substrate-binding protein PstS [Fervidicoccaceae archaeon]